MGRGTNSKAVNPLFGPRTGAGVTPDYPLRDRKQGPLFDLVEMTAPPEEGEYVYEFNISPCLWNNEDGWAISKHSNVDARRHLEACDLLKELEAHSEGESDLDDSIASFWLPVENETEYRGAVRRLEEIADAAGIGHLDHNLRFIKK